MRLHGRLKLGYYPLPPAEAERLRRFLYFPAAPSNALDPCAGDGGALRVLTDAPQVRRHGIELDAYRAEQAATSLDTVLHADACDVTCPVESLSLLYLNPPYDTEIGEHANRRQEAVFLDHTHRWLAPGGVLVLVIPGERLADCAPVLARQFRDVLAYRLSEPECLRYGQIALFAVRLGRRERERRRDHEIVALRSGLTRIAQAPQHLPPLPDSPDRVYRVPEGSMVTLTHHGLPLDTVEDQLPRSAAYRQAGRLLWPSSAVLTARPLTPLHGGHVGLLCTAGLLNGVFGTGPDRHVAHWQSVKLADRTEETDESGATVIRERERERFRHELALAYADGRTAVVR